MKLSDYKDYEALDLLVELIDPAAEIFSDVEIANILRNNQPAIKAVKIAIKNHKHAVIQILATLDGVDVKDYHCNVLTLPMALLNILNDNELMNFFASQGQNGDAMNSGSATESTEANEQ